MAEVQKKEFVCTGRLGCHVCPFLSISFCYFTVANPSLSRLLSFLLSFAHAFQDWDEGKYSSSTA